METDFKCYIQSPRFTDDGSQLKILTLSEQIFMSIILALACPICLFLPY